MGKMISFVKKRLLGLSFYKRLLYSYTGIVVLVLVLFAVSMYWGITGSIRGQVLASNYETLQQARNNMESYMQDVDTLMLNIASDATVQGELSAAGVATDYEGVTGAGVIRDRFNADVFIQKTNGVVIFATEQPYYPQYNQYSNSRTSGNMAQFGVYRDNEVAEDPWLQKTLAHRGGTLWLEPEYDPVRGQSEISANRPIPSTKNLKVNIGVIRVFVPTSRFGDLLGDISLGFGDDVYLAAGSQLIGGPGGAFDEALLRAAGSLPDGTARVTIQDEDYYLVSSTVSATSWKLIGLVPTGRLMAPYGFITQIILITLAIFLLATFLFLWQVSGSISRPILRVSKAMKDFEKHPDFRLPEEGRDGDIGILNGSYNRMMDRIDSLLNETRTQAASRRKAELQALQAQINPHFLYNTLDCIKSLAYVGAVEDIAQMTAALSDFYRGTLSGGNEVITLGQELSLTLSYCAVVKYRSKTVFEVDCRVEQALLERPIIKLSLQPLVENAILHGFSALRRPGLIRIRADERDGLLTVRVEDNGEGGDAEYLNGVLSGEYRPTGENSRRGYGIYSVMERIQLVFGPESGLSFEDNASGGITAIIRIRGREETHA